MTVFVHDGGGRSEARSAVLLVHGAGNDHTIWRFVGRRLAASGVRVLAPDLPAHGKTPGPALESIGEMADWCGRLLEASGVDDATVVGHSMGSLVTMQMAADGRARRVALLSTAPRMVVHPDLAEAARRKDRLAIDLIVGWTHTGRSRFGHHESAGMWMAGANRRLLERNLDSLATDLAACAVWDGADRFVEADVPTLIVVSESDRMTPARAGRELADRLGRCRLVSVPGGSHASLYDHPREVVDPLVDWITGRSD